MRPAHLKSPFTSRNRYLTIADRVFYLPDGCEVKDFAFPGWNHEITFPNEQPLCIEYCSGNGDWIAAKAKENPNCNWVAIEKKFPRVQKIWAKTKNFELPNLFMICGEGMRATKDYFPTCCAKEVYVNFPDPWPKRRHAKNRIVQPTFIAQIHRILKDQGKFVFVTDDEDYSKAFTADMAKSPGFQPVFAHPYYAVEYPGYGNSYFEDLWRQKGKEIRYHVYVKING